MEYGVQSHPINIVSLVRSPIRYLLANVYEGVFLTGSLFRRKTGLQPSEDTAQGPLLNNWSMDLCSLSKINWL
jgi:hypothetical protein